MWYYSQLNGTGPHINGLVQEICNSSALAMELSLSCAKTGLYSMRAYACTYACIRRLSAQLFILLSPVEPSAYADCRRQSSNMLNFQGQHRLAQAFQPITKALQGHRGPTRCSPLGRMRTYTDAYACLFILLSTAQLVLCSGDAQAAASINICAGCRRIRAHGV